DLSPVDEARGYERLIAEFSLTQQDVADAVGRDRSTVANALRLLKLPAGVLALLHSGELSVGHARALLALDDARVATSLAKEAVDLGLSVRDVGDGVGGGSGAGRGPVVGMGMGRAGGGTRSGDARRARLFCAFAGPIGRSASRVPSLERRVARLEEENGRVQQLAAALNRAEANYQELRTMLGVSAPREKRVVTTDLVRAVAVR